MHTFTHPSKTLTSIVFDHSNRNNGVCVRHGAKVKTCTHEGCTKQARKGGVCRIHSQNDGNSSTSTDQSLQRLKGEAD